MTSLQVAINYMGEAEPVVFQKDGVEVRESRKIIRNGTNALEEPATTYIIEHPSSWREGEKQRRIIEFKRMEGDRVIHGVTEEAIVALLKHRIEGQHEKGKTLAQGMRDANLLDALDEYLRTA
jgi:hypothetical protein